LRYIFFWTLETFCYVVVNCCVLLSAYFMVKSKFRISRILKFVIQVEFYSLLCGALLHFLFDTEMTMDNYMYIIYPLSSGTYWFASKFILLMIFSPFLNKIIIQMTKRQLFYTNVLLISVVSAIPTLFYWSKSQISNGYDVLWFIVLYFIGAYIRLHGISIGKFKCMIGYILLCVLAVSSRVLIGEASETHKELTIRIGQLYLYNSLVFLGASVLVFVFFSKIQINNRIISKIINVIGSVAFGVYLFHDNNLFRGEIWRIIDIPGKFEYGIKQVFLHIVVAVIIVFSLGCIIEGIRLLLMRILCVNKLMTKCDKSFEKFIEKTRN